MWHKVCIPPRFPARDMPSPTWHDIFLGQVNLIKFSPKEKIIALSIIKLIDKKTGLMTDPNWLYTVQNECNEDEEMVQSVRGYLSRELDPAGMCTTSVNECINIQIDQKIEHASDNEVIKRLKILTFTFIEPP